MDTYGTLCIAKELMVRNNFIVSGDIIGYEKYVTSEDKTDAVVAGPGFINEQEIIQLESINGSEEPVSDRKHQANFNAQYSTKAVVVTDIITTTLTSLYADLSSRTHTISGSTLPTIIPIPESEISVPYVYKVTRAFAIVEHTFTGSATDVLIIIVNGDITTTSTAKITLEGGLLSTNVFWVALGSFTITVSSSEYIRGRLIAGSGAININSGSKLDGGVYTTGAVTLTGATVTLPKEVSSVSSVSRSALATFVVGANGAVIANDNVLGGDIGSVGGVTGAITGLTYNGITILGSQYYVYFKSENTIFCKRLVNTIGNSRNKTISLQAIIPEGYSDVQVVVQNLWGETTFTDRNLSLIAL